MLHQRLRRINRRRRFSGFLLDSPDGPSYNDLIKYQAIEFMGLFITFEGIEGSGKSTQLRILGEQLVRGGAEVLVTREPGGCPIADTLRAILLDPASQSLVPRAELLLYAAARAQHVEQVIRPALAVGRIVLCDRFADATLAYQGGGRGLDGSLVAGINAIAAAGLAPDLTLIFDLPVDVGLGRARRRNHHEERHDEGRFELEELDFHRRVRDAYLALAAREPRIRVVDATGPIELVAARVTALIEPFLQNGMCA
jgi:dTMP kinase